MVGVSVDEWKRNVQNFEHVVTPAARVVEREFIVFIVNFICQSEALLMARDQPILLFIG